MSVFVGGYTPGTSPWKMGIRTGAQTPETTELLWLHLPSPSWAICLQRIQLKPKVPSAEAGSSLLAMDRLCLSHPCAVLLEQGPIPCSLCPGHPPATAEKAPQVIVQKNESSVSLIPVVLLPGELSPSVQTGNSFSNCVFPCKHPGSQTCSWSLGGNCWAHGRSHRKQTKIGLLSVLMRASLFALCPVPRGNST